MNNNHCCFVYPTYDFYQDYKRQHAAMMYWMQSLHSNIDMQSTNNINPTCQGSCHCSKANTKVCNSSEESTSSSYESSGTSSNPETGSVDNTSECYQEGDSDSEYEYELNVDAILAMRRAKEELKKDTSSDSSSIVMIDKEEFEFVELGSKQEAESKRSIMFDGSRDRSAELKYEKEFKKNLYGEKFTTIAGLETAMSLTYERLCDIHQPSFWPVYPLRLSSTAK